MIAEIIAAAFGFLVGILPFFKKRKPEDKEEKLGRIEVIQMLFGFIVCAACIIGAVLNTGDRETDKAAIDTLQTKNDNLISKSDTLTKKADTLKMNIATLSAQNDSLQKAFQDSSDKRYRNEVAQIQFTAFKMSKIFAENSKKELSQHAETQGLVKKIDTSKLKPADIELLPEPHNVFSFFCDSSTLEFSIKLKNLGDRVAYKFNSALYVVVKIKGQFFRIGNISPGLTPTFPPDITREISNQSFNKTGVFTVFCKEIDEIYCFIIGSYYLDEQLKVKRDFHFGLYKVKNDAVPSLWDDRNSMTDFINKAIIILN